VRIERFDAMVVGRRVVLRAGPAQRIQHGQKFGSEKVPGVKRGYGGLAYSERGSTSASCATISLTMSVVSPATAQA
jgi:hypothetical protein